VVFEMGWVTLSPISGGRGRPPTTFGVRKLESCGVVCVILRLAVLIQYWRATGTQTHDDG